MACGCENSNENSFSNLENMNPNMNPDMNPDMNQQNPIVPLRLEYVWLDGSDSKNMRSKVKYTQMDKRKINSIEDMLNMIPQWSFDGSSTKQSKSDNSDCLLKPVKLFPNFIERSKTPSFFVLCEVLDSEGNPHESNTRARLKKNAEEDDDAGFQFAVEQEYLILDNFTKKPIGWSTYDEDTPSSQGDYYCGIGSDKIQGRELAEFHANICNMSGIRIEGTNAEVVLSQWEYQTSPKSALHAADDLWMSRFILQRLAEKGNTFISFDPKPVTGDWNGSGAHINFSTRHMRENSDMSYMREMCSGMEKYHEDAISLYGNGNEKRLTGKHETLLVDKFSWGEMNRDASIRIPIYTVNNSGKGYLEDRRPAANVDPYEAFSHIVSCISEINKEMLVTS